MNERIGDYVVRCCACNVKIERVECHDLDDMMVLCRQCTNSCDQNPKLFNTSIQRFLIGNVI